MNLYEVIIDWKDTAFQAMPDGRKTEWSQITFGGYYDIDSKDVPKEVKDYYKKIRKIKV